MHRQTLQPKPEFGSKDHKIGFRQLARINPNQHDTVAMAQVKAHDAAVDDQVIHHGRSVLDRGTIEITVEHDFVGLGMEVQNHIVAVVAMNGEVIFDLRHRAGRIVVNDASHIGIFRISVDSLVQRVVGGKKVVESLGLMTSGDQSVVASTAIEVIESDVIAAAPNQDIVTAAGALVIATMAAFKHIALAAAGDYVVT